MLELKNLQYQYKDSQCFDFTLKLSKGESLAIIGPSGAGKSTLLNLIAGFTSPSKGEIFFDRQNITHLAANNRPVNILFQDNNCFGHLNVYQNVAIGISPSLELRPGQKEIIERALSSVGLSGFNLRFPHQLSGGQNQRIALARSIIRNKPILLLDEAFTSLDPPLKIEMLDLVKEISQEKNLTMLLVTHNYNDAARICDKTCFIQDGSIVYLSSTKQFAEMTKNSLIKKYIAAS